MNIRKLLLDTNILYKGKFCGRLEKAIQANKLEVYIPSIVHAERIRQIADKQGEKFSKDFFRQYLAAYRFQFLPFTQVHAEAIADLWLSLKAPEYNYNKKLWEKHRFDIVLCAVAHSTGYTLVTDERRGEHFNLIDYELRSEVDIWLDEFIDEE